MGITAEKRAGKATGKFRVELQRTVDGEKERYRQRHDTYAIAQADEERVLAMWAHGVPQDAVRTLQTTSGPLTLREAIAIVKAEGRVWKNSTSEAKCWSRMEAAARIIGDEPVETIDARLVNRLITSLESQGKASATINRYLSHLRRFLTECITLKLRKAPMEEKMFAWTEERDGRIVYFSKEEEQAIYEFLESRGRPEADAMRDLVEVAINTGCRPSELSRIKLEDIKDHRLTLWFTKNKKSRTLPLSPRTEALLTNLVVTGTMPTERGRRSWWERIREHMGKADDPDWVFYGCRHTCATRLLDANVNLYVIQAWMGHKVIQTTLRYAHMKDENLDQALVKLGNFMAGGLQEALSSAGFSVPQDVPHGGEYGAIMAGQR